MPFVVDASVALAWCFKDEQNDYARGVLLRLENEAAVVPSLWAVEVANGLLVAERRGRISSADLARVHAILSSVRIIQSDVALETALGNVYELAREHGLTVYDACYLHLAVVEGLPLATGDRDLQTAARRADVALMSP